MTLSISDFGTFHAAVHGGQQPFAWQQRLLEEIILKRAWPQVLDLPTGSGKTTCIDVALFALALDAGQEEDQRWCPRRIAMVVDRRIVVDQVAERGRKLLRALMAGKEGVVGEVAERLRSLSRQGEEPLGVFTLRGGMPKDDGWARSPDQPLVIASTVDQIGSRMLMQGYGVSQGMLPVHAGLLANDTLLLLDEVHLSEPFRQTLDQLQRLRNRFINGFLRPRFSHAFLSATPGVEHTPHFALLDGEKSPASTLGPRLHACKPTRLVEVEDRAALNKACVDHALDLLDRHQTIAVVVNRLASAGEIARRLADLLGKNATVTLLTGRMRPLDRDEVLGELRPFVQTGRQRSEDRPKRVVVGTQCIEAGADFDFDALVTQSASLDSLRQRFGRVDRLGAYQASEGVIVHDKSAKEDPIYGTAITKTVKWFKDLEKERPKKLKDELKSLKDEIRKLRGDARTRAEARVIRRARVDFGVLALEIPTGDDLTGLLAPRESAPTLLPAYLDLWMQTSLPPSQIPDVRLWLHGPRSGPADVQVVWRADLSEVVLRTGDVDTATSIVAAVRPSSLEAMSLPFCTVRAWLQNNAVLDGGDTEGPADEDIDRLKTEGRQALRWKGDKSEIVDAASLRPGDTIVVPAVYGGIQAGCFDAVSTASVTDRAEQAELFSRARPVLRLHPDVVGGIGLSVALEEPEEVMAELARLASNADWPAWKRLWADRLAVGRESFVVPGEPRWAVLEGNRVPSADLRRVLQPEESLEGGVELTTDGDESFCAGRSVTLAEHCADVERYAREYARRCGLGEWLSEHIAVAGWLHDVGKADRRFQLMLRGGSEIDFFKDETVWAKSPMSPGAREQRRMARLKSGYPGGGYVHAVQSVAMLHACRDRLKAILQSVDASKEPDLDLVLHLVASHHGECRPFAPVLHDPNPVDVALSGHESKRFGRIDFAATGSNNGLHRLDSPLADRFWGLVEKYGWLELCWFEAILRLADHRASEEGQARP
jgi:CRISPR-associated endonuclease/helicase Cas3